MNKIKEKKLNAIKSDILEIKDFVVSNSNNNINQSLIDNSTDVKIDDTLTLTNIVDSKKNATELHILTNIKQDIRSLKLTLIEHKKILNEILDKIR
ncbi:hypothetical protein OAR00_01150 [Alphaproteobacteria bacterium]|nr:hypothetical protein [Alphaproteobacteria bacterium]MDC1023140.1 hypothetical protein [Alphaproteobacteria bacterium]